MEMEAKTRRICSKVEFSFEDSARLLESDETEARMNARVLIAIIKNCCFILCLILASLFGKLIIKCGEMKFVYEATFY